MLEDPVGIAGSNEMLEACILTRESEKGGVMVNEKRAENGLKPLKLVFVDMILAEKDLNSRNYSNKVSSTNIRQFLSNRKSNLI